MGNRASIVAEHPIVMAVSYHVLKMVAETKGAQIDGVKNKFLTKYKPYKEPPNIHVNLIIPLNPNEKLSEENRWVTEVQFHFGDILDIKEAHHLYYELDRAAKDKLDMRFRQPIFKDEYPTKESKDEKTYEEQLR